MSDVHRTLRAMILDALSHAEHIAGRAQELTENESITLGFNEVRKAISEFRADHPAMKQLSTDTLTGFHKNVP